MIRKKNVFPVLQIVLEFQTPILRINAHACTDITIQAKNIVFRAVRVAQNVNKMNIPAFRARNLEIQIKGQDNAIAWMAILMTLMLCIAVKNAIKYARHV